jgi:hypothetical protein
MATSTCPAAGGLAEFAGSAIPAAPATISPGSMVMSCALVIPFGHSRYVALFEIAGASPRARAPRERRRGMSRSSRCATSARTTTTNYHGKADAPGSSAVTCRPSRALGPPSRIASHYNLRSEHYTAGKPPVRCGSGRAAGPLRKC